MLQSQLFGVSINIIGHVFFDFVKKNVFIFDFFVPKRGFALRKLKLAHILCICGSMFTFLDIFLKVIKCFFILYIICLFIVIF
jgi:hypothetical protein